MPPTADLHLKPAVLARYGLPDIAYPIAPADLQRALATGGELPLAQMLHALQQRSREANSPWRTLEPAMDRLAALLAPEDAREVLSAAGDTWWLELGPVDLTAELVTLQRDDDLIAAIRPRPDGRLRVAVFRPLDAKAARSLISLAMHPHPQYGVCMRENNWEYARDSSASTGNFYAADRGETYLSHWQDGLGQRRDEVFPHWQAMRSLTPRPAARVATELGVYYTLSAQPTEQSAEQAEAKRQEAPPETRSEPPAVRWPSKRQQRRTVQGRFAGCLLGGAVGDALGAPVEFMKRTEILQRFGTQGITQYAPAYGGTGRITDDTQMTLFTAEGLLRAWVRGCAKGITSYAAVTAHAYLRWLHTQGERSGINLDPAADEPGWLFQQRALHSRRAPGNTCLSALQQMTELGEPARNNSKGCGGVMRVAPVGLFAWRLRDQHAPEEAFRLGTALAALTHGHPTGALTGGVLAVLILALTDGASLPDALAAATAILRMHPEHTETLRAVEQAQSLAQRGEPPAQAIAQLGQGWIAEEALAIAVYCALVARSFRHGVLLAVNHDGDSDSTGAIAGNLLGAMHGLKAIPPEWLAPLELREVITEIAADLYAFRDWNIGEVATDRERDEAIWRKYPGF